MAFLGLIAGCASLPARSPLPPQAALAPALDSPLGRMAQASSPDSTLSGFRLLPSAAYAIDARVQLARRAQRSLDVQYYFVENDETGRYLLRQFRDAALRGVRVRLLIDDLHTAAIDPLLQDLAATPNLEIRLFNPFAAGRANLLTRFLSGLSDVARLNRRMHNKLLIADGVMALAGGRNLANEYFMRASDANFIDLDVFIAGAVLPGLSAIFDRYWNSEYVYPLHDIVTPQGTREDRAAAFEQATGLPGTPAPAAPPPNDVLGFGPLRDELQAGRLGLNWASAQAYADAPERVSGVPSTYRGVPLEDVQTVRYNVLDQMHRAQQSVVALSPYLVPGEAGLAWIHVLRQRGVAMTLITNSLASTDDALVHAGYANARPVMLHEGVDLYEVSSSGARKVFRLGTFGDTDARLHAKAAVIDGRTLFIGSMNMDPRSAHLNTELGLLIDSPDLAQQVLKLVDSIKRQGAYHVRLGPDGQTIEWHDARSGQTQRTEPDTGVWQRLLLRLLRPIVPESLL